MSILDEKHPVPEHELERLGLLYLEHTKLLENSTSAIATIEAEMIKFIPSGEKYVGEGVSIHVHKGREVMKWDLKKLGQVATVTLKYEPIFGEAERKLYKSLVRQDEWDKLVRDCTSTKKFKSVIIVEGKD